ncbi:hypothetical protein QBC32DRAFT_314968 [Pseudoneurospora amorphoporcata]|uniref:Vps41 beta-propeller domain-containing protein n=1 Tax=Pseudoneurospora amorphoporcata TaxID=241081 RepID=A0AAN6SFR6_9PEZI|nr:hypothetical protein QBC32DRAFT_314968 [Pseudoneurospora amorphoporcata]
MTQVPPETGDSSTANTTTADTTPATTIVTSPRTRPKRSIGSTIGTTTTTTSTATATGTGTDGASGITVEEEGSEDHGEEEETEEDDDDDDEEEEEDEEPRLKYARLTQHLGPLYRNGDATSAFLTAGDKMIVGTHNGNIHVLQLPAFQSLRVYHAHAASVTSLSISPYPPPLQTLDPKPLTRVFSQTNSPLRPGSVANEPHHQTNPASAARKRDAQAHGVPNTPSNNIHIATSSMDGNICVQSLIDVKDVTLRNFARPVQAVALSPDYKNDRTYLSGGLAGQLILTVGAPQGKSTATTTGAAAQAAGWLGNMVGAGSGKDTVLHSGEGTINTIKWSLSGKYVVWLNEHGIKIMRTKLYLESADQEDAWKRIGHIDRPQTDEWDTMASVWKGRAEWIDELSIEPDEPGKGQKEVPASPAAAILKQQQQKTDKKIERLVVGWGGNIWFIHVHPGGMGVGKHAGERSAGRAEIVKLLRMDCIISGLSLYTQNLLLVLAYCLPDEDEDEEFDNVAPGHKHTASIASTGSQPSGGIKRRQNNPPPELRLIDLTSQAEIDKDALSVSRFERLTASDYHLGVLPARNVAASAANKGTLETLAGFGTDMLNVGLNVGLTGLNAALNPKSLFSSGASIKSRESDEAPSSYMGGINTALKGGPRTALHPNLNKPGIKIFIHSPYDCILATKRDLADHLGWLLERQQYRQAWELVDEHPEIVAATDRASELGGSESPVRTQSDDFDDDTASVMDGMRSHFSLAEKEKRRIGELWIQELVEANDWTHAGQICGKVLGTPDRWEKWVWTFAGANKFDDIVNYIPTERTRPPIPGTIYEVVLGHYLQVSKPRFRQLLERWPSDLFDVVTIITALENQLKYRDVREDSVEDGEVGRDWRIVMESLAKLHEASGRTKEALRCYIKLQDADSAMRLIKDGHLAEAVADDIPSFIGLRVPQDKLVKMTKEQLEQATSEAISLLVDEAQHGLVKPDLVVSQLQEKDLKLYTYFYLRGLWRGEGIHEHTHESLARLVLDSRTMVDQFADLAVHLFAIYDQPLLNQFLRTSTAYAFEKAAHECETRNYIPELVYLYSKTGQMKRALYLIIERLGDVSRAIAFAKEQDDPDLWEDLLEYSMDKPKFIRALLEEVGTAINPITLVRRIPEGLQIPGLREGIRHIMKEHEIQYSISEGVSRVLRSEVAAAMNTLRNGQRKGVKFQVGVKEGGEHVDVQPTDIPTQPLTEKPPSSSGINSPAAASQQPPPTPSTPTHRRPKPAAKKYQAGHCAQCLSPFTTYETDTLVGFACGHVFHLPHLLEALNPGKTVDADVLLGGMEERSAHLVGAKVTHARLLRDRIVGGCVVCKAAKEDEGKAR